MPDGDRAHVHGRGETRGCGQGGWHAIKVETHGSIGVDSAFSHADIAAADAVIIAADIAIDKERFVNKRLVTAGVDAAISHPEDLLRRALVAPRWGQHGKENQGGDGDHGAGTGGRGGASPPTPMERR